MAHKWTKTQIEKMLTTKKANAILRAATKPAKRGRATHAPSIAPINAHYVGETAQAPAVDIQRIEDRAFRRGMFTAFQMLIDLFVRELR